MHVYAGTEMTVIPGTLYWLYEDSIAQGTVNGGTMMKDNNMTVQ